MELKVINKNSPNHELAYKLTHDEFKCRCSFSDCTFTLVNHRVLLAFDCIRATWGGPIFVNSGFRCQKHNSNVGGARDSWHKKGSAIDIRPEDPEDLMKLYNIAVKFFDLIIIYEDDGFLHCQMEE